MKDRRNLCIKYSILCNKRTIYHYFQSQNTHFTNNFITLQLIPVGRVAQSV
jgi:hypothetical protein